MSSKKDAVGAFIVEGLRDVALEMSDGLIESRFTSPGHRDVQAKLKDFTPEQKAVLRQIVAYCVDGALNDFLWALDRQSKVSLHLEGSRVEGLHSRVWTQDGWLATYSKFDRVGGRKTER